MPDTPLILLFVKAPRKGQVKSRLAAVMGQDTALELYRNFVLDILASVEKSGVPCRVCYYPADSGETVRQWLGDRLTYMPQEGNNLGERMEQAFRRVFSEGISRAVLIGSDIPDLPPALLQDAVERLDRMGAVIGPSKDGGYYLIGFRKDAFFPNIFHGPEWSTETVFRKTMQIFRQEQREVSLLSTLQDVDTINDLKDLMERGRSSAFRASRTMVYLAGIETELRSSEVRDAKV
jgi:rSAM/selenodomain-associated transferase 1